MRPTRIAELLEPFLEPATAPTSCHFEPAHAGEEPGVLSPANDQGLTTVDLERISTYIDLLLRWNTRINLTAIRDPEEIVTRHFGESLFAARLLFPNSFAAPASSALKAVEVADLGSGAGFPGLPIKLWAPHISLTLIESSQKKATFLREVVRALTLTSVNILNARAQDLVEGSERLGKDQPGSGQSFDVVTLRAVERFEAILPVAATLVAPEGRLALLIGSPQLELAVAALPTLSWDDPVPVPISRSRVVAIAYRKPLGLPG